MSTPLCPFIHLPKSNLSSSSTASSSSSSSWTKGGSALPTKKEDITESFKLFVKQVTSNVDENLAPNAPNINPGATAWQRIQAQALQRLAFHEQTVETPSSMVALLGTIANPGNLYQPLVWLQLPLLLA